MSEHTIPVSPIYLDASRRLDDPTIPYREYAGQLDRALGIVTETGAASLHEHAVHIPLGLNKEQHLAWGETGVEELGVEEIRRSSYRLLVTSCLAFPSYTTVQGWAAAINAQLAEAGDLAGTTVYLGLEDLGSCEGQLSRIDELYAAGIRIAGIAYNLGNPFGTGLETTTEDGLSTSGVAAVKRMNELKMVIDLSHSSAATTFDAARVSQLPIVLTHAGAAAVWPSRRMKSDDEIKAVVSTGGMIGIEAAPGSTRTDPSVGTHSVDDLVRHIEYCAELVGVDHVGLGGDTFYGDHLALYRVDNGKPLAPENAVDFSAGHVAGAENLNELPVQVALRLLSKGWPDADVAKVIGGNITRLFADPYGLPS